MNQNQASQIVEILNPEGMHARPADLFAKCAGQYKSQVSVVSQNGETINGKSILDLLTLAAVQGTQLTIQATGEDATEAIQTLSGLVASGFDASQLDLGSAT